MLIILKDIRPTEKNKSCTIIRHFDQSSVGPYFRTHFQRTDSITNSDQGVSKIALL